MEEAKGPEGMLEDSGIEGSPEEAPKNPPDKPNPRGGRCHSTMFLLQGTSLGFW